MKKKSSWLKKKNLTVKYYVAGEIAIHNKLKKLSYEVIVIIINQ